MTRITNFGRKRTYLEAGLSLNEDNVERAGPQEAIDSGPDSITRTEPASDAGPGLPPKKKSKRTKMSKRDGNPGSAIVEAVGNDGIGEGHEGERMISGAGNGEGTQAAFTEDTITKSEKKKRQRDKQQKGLSASEHRRRKRMAEKAAATTCFACRAKGHAAKDCPVTKSHRDGGNGDKKQMTIVGMCYRCGSTRHTLSRCKKPTNPEDPLPFASCFVCSGKGHLASSCPQNKAKGIYPNGGCCKLCGDTSHLAKDCALRTRSTAELEGSAVLGTGREVGADEDDFHVLKRNTKELDRGDRMEERMRRLLRTKAGVISNNVKPGAVPKPSVKKVVYF